MRLGVATNEAPEGYCERAYYPWLHVHPVRSAYAFGSEDYGNANFEIRHPLPCVADQGSALGSRAPSCRVGRYLSADSGMHHEGFHRGSARFGDDALRDSG